MGTAKILLIILTLNGSALHPGATSTKAFETMPGCLAAGARLHEALVAGGFDVRLSCELRADFQ